MNNWFEVDKDGFRALQLGKPKYYAIRELIQNAIDEKITKCKITTSFRGGRVSISVEDDGPGFRDINDAYTLFGATYKQSNPELRGRFNLGEKQAFAICNKAMIETTSGTVVFDEKGRTTNKHKKFADGTKVTIQLKMTKKEYAESMMFIRLIIPPVSVRFSHNDSILPHPTVFKQFETSLRTEKLHDDGQFRPTVRKTKVDVYKTDGVKYLYELGIPVCEIECDYSIDVNQRVPLGFDRDKVPQYYLQDLYAEVLNYVHEDLTQDNISETWVREAMCDDRIERQAVETVINKRFGDKAIIASPGDGLSIDDAKAAGCNIVYGAEMSKAEWENVRKHNLMQSTTEVYGRGTCDSWDADKTDGMKQVEKLAKKIYKEVYGTNLHVRFIECETKNTPNATFGMDGLTFYVSRLGENFFERPLDRQVLDLMIHEMGHRGGMHTERGYHSTLTDLSARLILLALNEPEFFAEFEVN